MEERLKKIHPIYPNPSLPAEMVVSNSRCLLSRITILACVIETEIKFQYLLSSVLNSIVYYVSTYMQNISIATAAGKGDQQILSLKGEQYLV